MWTEIEILKRLETLLGPLADRLQLPSDQLALLVVVLLLLALIFLAKEAQLHWLQSRRRARHLQLEVGRLAEETDANQARLDEVFVTLQSVQQWQKEERQTSEDPEADESQRAIEELSKISFALLDLKEAMEQLGQSTTEQTDLSTLGQDILADLPQEREGRIAALEQRRQVLFAAIRDCNQAIEDERRTPMPPGPPTLPREQREDVVDETLEQEQNGQAGKIEEPNSEISDTPPPDPPVPPTPEVTETDFSRILSEDFERELLRLILRENGRPNSESIRLVLGTRFQHVVQDEINERAQNVLGDDLLYEEDGRLVVSEEFVDDLRRFLNERAIPARRV